MKKFSVKCSRIWVQCKIGNCIFSLLNLIPKHPPKVVHSNLNYGTKSGTRNALHHPWMVGKLGFAQYISNQLQKENDFFLFLCLVGVLLRTKKKKKREIAFIEPLLLRRNDSIEILHILEILKTCKNQIGCGLNYKLNVRKKKLCSWLNSNGLRNYQHIRWKKKKVPKQRLNWMGVVEQQLGEKPPRTPTCSYPTFKDLPGWVRVHLNF